MQVTAADHRDVTCTMQVCSRVSGMRTPKPARVSLRSPCPIAGALDLVGDRWTLLVMRDLLLYDKRRFADFLGSPEGIASNILADRLDRLERCGVLTRRRYADHPP